MNISETTLIWKSVPEQGPAGAVIWKTYIGTPSDDDAYNFVNLIAEVFPTDVQQKDGEKYREMLKRSQEDYAKLLASSPLLVRLLCDVLDVATEIDDFCGEPLIRHRERFVTARERFYNLRENAESILSEIESSAKFRSDRDATSVARKALRSMAYENQDSGWSKFRCHARIPGQTLETAAKARVYK